MLGLRELHVQGLHRSTGRAIHRGGLADLGVRIRAGEGKMRLGCPRQMVDLVRIVLRQTVHKHHDDRPAHPPRLRGLGRRPRTGLHPQVSSRPSIFTSFTKLKHRFHLHKKPNYLCIRMSTCTNNGEICA